MDKHLKLCLLLVIIFTPVLFSKVDTTAEAPSSIIYPISLLPETQDDANTGGDAGDNFDNATIIGIGSFTGSLPENDTNDFYKVYINMDRHAVITLSGDVGTDFDLHLYAPDRNIMTSSQGSDSNEYISFDILSYGYWFVRIEKYNLTSHGNYSLIIQTSAITSTVSTFIQNDAGSGGDASNSFYFATPITRGQHNGILIDFDFYDYYRIDLISGDVISILLTFQESINFDLFLYDPDVGMIASSTTESSEESISLTVEVTGPFRILISRLTSFGAYEINIQVSHPGELDFNWKALVIFVSVLAIIFGIFITIRLVRRRPTTKIQKSQIKDKSESVKQKDLSSSDSKVLNFEEALVDSGKDLSEEEKEVLDKIIKGYSTRKE